MVLSLKTTAHAIQAKAQDTATLCGKTGRTCLGVRNTCTGATVLWRDNKTTSWCAARKGGCFHICSWSCGTTTHCLARTQAKFCGRVPSSALAGPFQYC